MRKLESPNKWEKERGIKILNVRLLEDLGDIKIMLQETSNNEPGLWVLLRASRIKDDRWTGVQANKNISKLFSDGTFCRCYKRIYEKIEKKTDNKNIA